MILEKTIRIPRSLSVKAAGVLKGFLNKVPIMNFFCTSTLIEMSLQNPSERLGCHPQTGFQDITSHAFYKSIEWDHVSVCSVKLFR